MYNTNDNYDSECPFEEIMSEEEFYSYKPKVSTNNNYTQYKHIHNEKINKNTRNKFVKNEALNVAQECAYTIHQICKDLASSESFLLVNNYISQILKSSTSVCANIAENSVFAGEKTFIHKINISLGEANETIAWLQMLYYAGYLSGTDYNNLYDGYIYIIRMLTKTLTTMRNKTL